PAFLAKGRASFFPGAHSSAAPRVQMESPLVGDRHACVLPLPVAAALSAARRVGRWLSSAAGGLRQWRDRPAGADLPAGAGIQATEARPLPAAGRGAGFAAADSVCPWRRLGTGHAARIG